MKYIFLNAEKMNIAAEQVQVFFHNNNKEKTIGILKGISAKINVNHNRNSILFFSKLDIPIR